MSSKNIAANGDCLGWAARDPSGVLSPYTFSCRALGTEDVSARITHCGVCYADVICTRNKLGNSLYPVVPGHEIVGVVKAVGSNVHYFKVGDHVSVGTHVDSCRDCHFCNDGLDIYCEKSVLRSFNGVDTDGTVTKGGYSSYILVHNRYCNRIRNNYPLASAAPLFCAGITVYSPMMRHKMNQWGKSLRVVGLGGLEAFGLNVMVFRTSLSKKEEALSLLGADKFVVSSDHDQMKENIKYAYSSFLLTTLSMQQAHANSLDFIVDTASGDHSFDLYMSLLKSTGVLALVGYPSEIKLSPASLLLGMKTISASVVGGTKEIQEMLDFCAAKGIYPNIEVIPIQYANEALERLIKKISSTGL